MAIRGPLPADDPEEGGDFHLVQEGYRKNNLITYLLEPEPIGDQLDPAPQDHEHEKDDYE